ncbi:DUF2171 domain-containing protein [Paracraurococcus lichenis]|uniref:DUF2171 domain-containing protein n=1 Tax=Paracraurococcus lichenis TaxID=3064888 RepID=A0ABT9DU07_9PROT|nr:DUF2171 domain-containing protein [Paracraurococcus sp. LOR1-02]MDO9707358.1 DUF2171 domain-containing protein [Paracraurococcus sp. LOR1-02]
MTTTGEIRPHMEIIGSDGAHVGTVDRLELGHLRLTRRDDPDGSGRHHHSLPLSVVAEVEAGRVRLTLPAQQARAMAVGGMTLPEALEGAVTDDEPGERDDGAGVSPMGDQAGTGTGNIHGGGIAGPGSLPGWGTGQGTAGSGFPDDPNMDRHGGSDPGRVR